MAERHITQTYTNSFKKFLSFTDEKSVLLSEITKRVKEREPDSFLDIGAGNGDLAIPISKLVKGYIALEQKPDYVEKLKDTGIEVIEATFPCKIQKKFNFVLASHSLPWKKKKYEPFITSALDLLNNRGVFLGITYDDEKGDWNDMLRACNFKLKQISGSRLENMEDWLKFHSSFKKTIIATLVRADFLNDIIEALAFVYSDGDHEKMEIFMKNKSIREHLKNKYKDERGYYFPFNHIFLEMEKLK